MPLKVNHSKLKKLSMTLYFQAQDLNYSVLTLLYALRPLYFDHPQFLNHSKHLDLLIRILLQVNQYRGSIFNNNLLDNCQAINVIYVTVGQYPIQVYNLLEILRLAHLAHEEDLSKAMHDLRM